MVNVHSRLRVFVAVLFLIITIGTISFKYSEGISLADAFYFCVVTITTVGYGDIHPITPLGKYLAILLIITGGITFLAVVANATEIFMNRRERQIRKQKLNIIIGVYCSELGGKLLNEFKVLDKNFGSLQPELIVKNDWNPGMFKKACQKADHYKSDLDLNRTHFVKLKDILKENSDLLLQLLLNVNLLEHEMFTDLIQATSHLKEELLCRENFDHLPQSDLNHLKNDVVRVYQILIHQWLSYLEHLKKDFPYLFSFAIRTNPFDTNAEAIINR